MTLRRAETSPGTRMPELFDCLLEVEAFLRVQQYSLLRLEDVVDVLQYLELCGV